MPRLAHRLPSYRLHRPSGRAVVTLAGRDYYLGTHGTPESRAEYDRLIGEWLASARGRPKAAERPRQADTPGSADPTVGEVILAFLRHAETHYRDADGVVTREVQNLKDSLRPVRKLYLAIPARSFGPLALRAVRETMVKAGLARKTINGRINRVRHVFKWACSMEMIPSSVVEALRTVDGLRAGRTPARETVPVRPVSAETVEATLPYLSRTVSAMVRLQLLTGMRAGEVQIMRGVDIDTSGAIWEYRPHRHKTMHRGRDRVIPIGPRAQEILRVFLVSDPSAYLFEPAESMAEMRRRRAEERKTKVGPAERKRNAQRAKKRRQPSRTAYVRCCYRQAIARACDLAFPHPTLSTGPEGQLTAEQWAELVAWRKGRRWSPLQLRHTAATAIRARYGLEATQAVLGHATADVTQIYAERDLGKAVEVMREVG